MEKYLEYVDVQKLLSVERKKRNMSFEDVAKHVGCSASYIFRLEKGKRKTPSFRVMAKLLDLFQITKGDLMNYLQESVHIDTGEILEDKIIKFIKNMDANNFENVSHLLELIKEYQNNEKGTEVVRN